jgi:hypothetical protein
MLTRWEYRVEEYKPTSGVVNTGELKQRLDRLGDEGWELTLMSEHESGEMISFVTLVLKRAVQKLGTEKEFPIMDQDYGHSNELFHLGWLEDEKMANVYLGDLARIAGRLECEGGASELDTIAILVEPLLRGLGWETLNHDEVDRAPAPDYELWGKDRGGTNKKVAIIEVENFHTRTPHLRQHAYEQLRGYVVKRLNSESVVKLGGEPFLCGVVTNGRSWHIYDFHGQSQNLKCEFELGGDSDKGKFLASLDKGQLLRRLGL